MEKNISMQKLFEPKSIAIIGASSNQGKVGYKILNNIKSAGFKGNVYPINPKADEILGYHCYHSISKISDQIDLAIIVVPKRFTLDTIEELLAQNVKSIILITAGFKETGEEGKVISRTTYYKYSYGSYGKGSFKTFTDNEYWLGASSSN